MPTQETFVVIDAPGTYGEHTTVWYATTDLAKARAFAKRGRCQILAGCAYAKGRKILRGPLVDMIASGHWKIIEAA